MFVPTACSKLLQVTCNKLSRTTRLVTKVYSGFVNEITTQRLHSRPKLQGCFIKVYMTRNFLSPSWKDLLKLYNNFFCSSLRYNLNV